MSTAIATLIDLVATRQRNESGLEPELSPGATPADWQVACEELGIALVRGGSPLRKTACGIVDGHELTMALIGGTAHEQGVRVRYTVRFAADHAPSFSLTRGEANTSAVGSTGNMFFDAAVATTTDDADSLKSFLSDERRAQALDMLGRWPTLRITNYQVEITTGGVQDNVDEIVESIHELVETAKIFGRPNSSELRLDEPSVLADLFNSRRDADGVSTRFEELYQGSEVSWHGQVLTVGSIDKAGQRVAILVGSANGRDAQSGRVVALTVIDPERCVAEGDVVNFDGRLCNLDSKKRLFRIE